MFFAVAALATFGSFAIVLAVSLKSDLWASRVRNDAATK